MSTEQNKATVRRVYDEVVNRGNMTLIEELWSPDYVNHAAAPGTPPTRDSLRAYFTALRTAFPDIHYRVDDTIAEGDKVVIRTTVTGTMKGDFSGMAASGKSASWEEIHITKFKDGKVASHWSLVDQLKMLQQLGFAEAPRQTASTTRKR